MNRIKLLSLLSLLMLSYTLSFGQNVTVNGYIFEDGNRGYLNQVNINIVDKETGQSVATLSSNKEGYFETELAENRDYVAYAEKQLFGKVEQEFDTNNLASGEKKFLKIKLLREPGYDFQVTIAPKRDSDDIPVDAIRGAWIEVYNNTTKKEVLNLKDHPELEFNVHFDKGNHYTVMIRKEGFFTKRMEAYVNVEGCILCFEGVGSIRPGVVDNLTEGNDMGVLLTNVELDPLFSGKTFEVSNIYYDFGKATLRSEAKGALVNLAQILNDNPHIKVELGSHTDSRGKTEANQTLSENRAKSAVDYLVNNLDVSRNAIIAAGYGESNLSNKCSDGVSCTEEEHQKNRRTEITVLNVNDTKRERKSLKDIRVEEEFIKSVMSDENETATEEEIKNTKASQKKTSNLENKKNTDSTKSGNGKIIENKTVAESKSSMEKSIQTRKSNSETKPTIEKTSVILTANGKTEEVTVTKMEKAVVREPAPRSKSTNAEISSISQEDLENTEIVNANKDAAESAVIEVKTETVKTVEEPTKIISEKVVKDEKVIKEESSAKQKGFLLGNYTGYKVVVQFSRYPLNSDHVVYERHGDLVEYKATSGSYLYMVGDFAKEIDAKDFLDGTISLVYPGAYVVQFTDGRRMK